MIVISAASGHLGRLVAGQLLDRGLAAEVTLAVRNPDKVADLAARGVQVRRGDYDDPDSLKAAFAGADRLLLISGNEVGRRVEQHRAAIQAAAEAGVGFVAYTSVVRADTTTLPVAPDHHATEQALAASGVRHALLRNNWYTEMYLDPARAALDSGAIIGSAGGGRVASASRADFAAAAVAVLTTDGHDGAVYELTGDTAWTKADLAAELSRISGREVVYRDVPAEEHRAALVAAGVPELLAGFYVTIDQEIARGALAETTADLRRLTGRPSTPLAETLTEALPA